MNYCHNNAQEFGMFLIIDIVCLKQTLELLHTSDNWGNPCPCESCLIWSNLTHTDHLKRNGSSCLLGHLKPAILLTFFT